MGLEVWMTFIEVGWEGLGADNATWLEEAIFRDNYCNWFNRFITLILIDLTIPLV